MVATRGAVRPRGLLTVVLVVMLAAAPGAAQEWDGMHEVDPAGAVGCAEKEHLDLIAGPYFESGGTLLDAVSDLPTAFRELQASAPDADFGSCRMVPEQLWYQKHQYLERSDAADGLMFAKIRSIHRDWELWVMALSIRPLP